MIIMEKKTVTTTEINLFNELRAALKNASELMDLFEMNRINTRLNQLYDEYDFMDQRFTENGKVGVRRANGTVVIPAVNDEVVEVYRLDINPMAYPVRQNGLVGMMRGDGSGTMVTPCQYDKLEFDPCIPGFLAEKDGRIGLVHMLGVELIPCELTQIGQMCDGIMPVKIGDKWGFYAASGEYVRPEYDELGQIFCGSGPVDVRRGDEWDFVECETHRFITKEEYENDDFDLISSED